MLGKIKETCLDFKSVLIESWTFLAKNPYLYFLCLIVESRTLIFSLTKSFFIFIGLGNFFIIPLNLISTIFSIVLIGWSAVVVALQLKVYKQQPLLFKDLWPLIKKYFGKLFSFKVIELFLFCMFILFTFSQSGKSSDFISLLTDTSYQAPFYLSVLTFFISIFYFYFDQVIIKMVVDDSTISLSLKSSIKYVINNLPLFALIFLIRTLVFFFISQLVSYILFVPLKQIIFLSLTTCGTLVINYILLIKYLSYNSKSHSPN